MAILPVLSLLCAVFALSMATDLKVVEKRAVCDLGWSACGGRCFRFFPHHKTWSEAEKYCVSQGGHLASIHNIQDANFVRDLSKAVGRRWIGGGRSGSAPGWYWTDGSSFSYTRWSKKQPDDWRGNEPCVHIYTSGHWNDAPCYLHYPFVCAK